MFAMCVVWCVILLVLSVPFVVFSTNTHVPDFWEHALSHIGIVGRGGVGFWVRRNKFPTNIFTYVSCTATYTNYNAIVLLRHRNR